MNTLLKSVVVALTVAFLTGLGVVIPSQLIDAAVSAIFAPSPYHIPIVPTYEAPLSEPKKSISVSPSSNITLVAALRPALSHSRENRFVPLEQCNSTYVELPTFLGGL